MLIKIKYNNFQFKQITYIFYRFWQPILFLDATGKLVMPGGIDTHTHCQMPFMGTQV